MPSSIQFLKTLPFFHNLGDVELERIAKNVLILSLDKAQIIFLEGENNKGLYALSSGSVRIFKTSPEGREQTIRVVLAGDTFNDVSVFDGGPNPASAVALTSSVIYLIPRESLLSLVSGCPTALAIITMMAQRIRHLNSLIENLSFRSVVSRLAKLLLDTAVAESNSSPVPRLTQDEMAAMVGSVRDVVGRALKALEKSGAIEIRGHRIVILSTQKLKDKI
jgi:CRP-like cAMP-binding protein